MRLNFIPELPQGLVASLEEHSIRTDSDFLSLSIVELLRNLPPGVATIGEIKRYKAIVAEASSAPGHSAKTLFDSTSGNDPPTVVDLPSSLACISPILAAHSGRIVELVGEGNSMKSEFALNLILRFLAANIDSASYWVDTAGDFSPDKASRIASYSAEVGLDRIHLSPALEIEELYDILDEIVALAKSGAPVLTVGYLVIDCITSLLGPLLSAAPSQGHAVMVNLMRQLKDIAQDHSITVIVINNSTSNSLQHGSHSMTRKPALGPTFAFLTDATLWVAPHPTHGASRDPSLFAEGSEDRVVYHLLVLKSNSTPAHTSGTFSLNSNFYLSSSI
ncbi:hypothetical protein P691DRAFT_708249 [Macrolepiota fuliginosa MF-IS2]|uniref:RecA family profile 1 domain-containing protein n=1 Tax=Macrolepiota fuliginosa MF-IS2 TaxID=1400762 RepID=A0A9P5XBL2_9AGAR|nr:hypothetical protein P691DRAFT_708249 [Macrolepiota fuliginosa MF-IS2]